MEFFTITFKPSSFMFAKHQSASYLQRLPKMPNVFRKLTMLRLQALSKGWPTLGGMLTLQVSQILQCFQADIQMQRGEGGENATRNSEQWYTLCMQFYFSGLGLWWGFLVFFCLFVFVWGFLFGWFFF